MLGMSGSAHAIQVSLPLAVRSMPWVDGPPSSIGTRLLQADAFHVRSVVVPVGPLAAASPEVRVAEGIRILEAVAEHAIDTGVE